MTEYRITRNYLHLLFSLFWDDTDGPCFNCLIEWTQNDIIILQTLQILAKKYQARVKRLFPHGFSPPHFLPGHYFHRAYADFNDYTGCLIGLPIYLDGLVKIRVVARLCQNGCYALAIKYDQFLEGNRQIVIVEIIRELTTPKGLNIFSPFYMDIMNQKQEAYHDTVKKKFPMYYHIDPNKYLYPSGDSFHYRLNS